MVYYSLLSGGLKKKKKIGNWIIHLKIFIKSFIKIESERTDRSFDSNFQRKLVSGIKTSEDVKNFLLALSELSKHMQDDIDMYIRKDIHNERNFPRKLDPMLKNLLCKQNPLELVFKNNFYFWWSKSDNWKFSQRN